MQAQHESEEAMTFVLPGECSVKTESPEHYTWRAMLRRCRAKKKNYEHVRVCKRWLKYRNFLMDMGRRPTSKHSLDRYPNAHGNYSPKNCRWATWKEQHRNKRATRLYSDGKRVGTIPEWSEWLGISRELLWYRRVHRGTLVPGKSFWVKDGRAPWRKMQEIPRSCYTKSTRWFEHNGVIKSLPEWAEKLGISMQCGWRRWKRWHTFEKGKVYKSCARPKVTKKLKSINT